MYFEELKLGMSVILDEAIIDENDMINFALKYDNVPLHTDKEYAKNTHFKQIIAPGVMSFMSVWAKYLEKDFFGNELIAGLSTKIEWFKPVFAFDVLKGVAEITDLKIRNEKNGLATVTIMIKNQNDELVIKDTTEAVIKRKIEK